MSSKFSCLTLAIFSSIPYALATPIRRQGGASAYCTNSDLSYALSSISPPQLSTSNARTNSSRIRKRDAWSLQVDDGSSKQTIDGFGAAVTDATVTSFNSLDSGALDDLLSTLVTSSGADFSLMRHTIGASDLSGDPAYTYDDNGGNADENLNGFNLGDRGEAMAEMLSSMTSKQSDLKILGSPWSAPGWMKINGQLTGDTTNNNLADQYLSSDGPNYSSQFAQYFVKYIQAFASHGANIDAITLQNEPLNSQGGYPTMYMFDYEQADLITSSVSPALQSAGLGDISIWAYDHNTDHAEYPQHVLDNSNGLVNTVAWHCYATNVDWTDLTTFQNSNPNVAQYMTECWTPGNNWYEAADFTIGPLQNFARGVIAWTLGTDSSDGPSLSSGGCHNCRGLVTINDDGSVTYNIAYYLMAQFSKFMPKGAVVLDGSGSYQDVQSVATKNPDGTITVVIENKQGNDLDLTVTLASGNVWEGNVPATSVTTWVLPA